MNILLFGASGMIGGGVLAECLDDDSVDGVVSVSRRSLGISHPKLREIVVADLFNLASHVSDIGSPDACLYCLGVASAGMSESEYRRITFDLTVLVADVLEVHAPDMVFAFVSGQGTGTSRAMWARVKHEAENELLTRTFDTYLFRPGFIQPVNGAKPRTTASRNIAL